MLFFEKLFHVTGKASGIGAQGEFEHELFNISQHFTGVPESLIRVLCQRPA